MPCRHAFEQVEVILDDVRVDRLAGDVNDPRVGILQPDECEQQAFLVERGTDYLAEFFLVDAQGWHDHRRMRVVGIAVERRPDFRQAFLERLKAFDLVRHCPAHFIPVRQPAYT
jgi:hypothetical protein